MKAGEAKPYFENLQEDLLQEADLQLRSWYETEVSFTPEYQEAAALKERVDGFRFGLVQLIEKAKATEISSDPETGTVFEGIEEVIDEDEWLTPEERKRKSVLAWLKDTTSEYHQGIRAANRERKQSKREKQRVIAGNKFARRFERFGGQDEHIVYDPEALGYVLDELQESKPHLAELVTRSAVEYMHKYGLEFVANHAAFAGIIRGSIQERPSAAVFDSILKAIYEKQDFVRNPQAAALLHIALAHTVFDVSEDSNLAYYRKVIDTAYLQNDIIAQKAAYVTAIGFALSAESIDPTITPLFADLMNAKSTFGQGRFAYLDHHEHYADDFDRHYSDPLARAMGERRIVEKLEPPEYIDILEKDFWLNSHHYDIPEVFDLTTGERIASPSDGKSIPERIRSAYTSSELYCKRISLLTPRAVAHDLLLSTIREAGSKVPAVHIFDIPISPTITVSFCNLGFGGDLSRIEEFPFNKLLISLLRENGEVLVHERFAPSDERVLGVGYRTLAVEDKQTSWGVFAVVRPSIPEDIRDKNPHMALISTFGLKVFEYLAGFDRAKAAIEGKKDYIRQNRHNYLGRRPIKFQLPDEYREKGLMSVEMRQHPDRSRIIVTTHHAHGDIEFLFDENMSYCGREVEGNQNTPLTLMFEDLVVSLISEWACRPVVETSEGRVSADENGSRVNLGYLRYLPPGFRFSERQRLIFKKEQHGANLAAESQRRKTQDPTGLGRNSTYVRENYDPTKPPLEIYYDPTVLTLQTS